MKFLEQKTVMLVLKKLEHFSLGQTIPIATNDTTVVSYINKEEGKTCNIPGCLYVIAEKRSQHKRLVPDQKSWVVDALSLS